jgi:hypothetical protein
VRPIFRAGQKEILGQQQGTNVHSVVRLVAEPGYAVGAMTVRATATAEGIKLTFMKIKGDSLDPNDSRESEWVGDSRPEMQTKLTANGQPIVGIFGQKSKEHVAGIGLVFDRKAPDLSKPPVAVQWIPPQVGKTGLLGGGFGKGPFQEAAPEGALLVGLEIGLGFYNPAEVIHAVRPVFRAGEKDTRGQQQGTNLNKVTCLLAKPGFAVGAVTVKTGANADGLSVTFMRIKGDRLDPTDAYESEWVGDVRPGGKTILTGEGRPVVGIFGTKNNENVTGIGLLFDRNAN